MKARYVVAAALALAAAASPVAARTAHETPSPKQQAKAFFEDGLRKQQAGDYRGAIRAYDVSLSQDPQQAEALSHRGFCYQQLQQYPKALADYEAAMALAPKNKLNREAAEELKTLLRGATPAPTP
jgi:tetratricopeptide (TPR) repeat protein